MQQYGGVSRYFSELITRFMQSPEILPQVAVSITNNHFVHQIDRSYLIPGVLYSHSIRRPTPSDPYARISQKIVETIRNNVNGHRLHTISIKNIQNSIDALQKGAFDIFHPTYFSPYFLPYLNNKPFVITIYDLVHEKYPEFFPLHDETIHNRKILLNKADHIIAISENTKRDIIEFYAINPKKITTVYLGNEHIGAMCEEDEDYSFLPESFLLYVGDRSSYKNFPFTVEAITPILLKLPNLHLVCYGGGKFTESEQFFIEKMGLKDRAIQIGGDDGILHRCYQRAIALIYPSLYEGFGIPIIEAFAIGCPVIASNIPTSKEIAGDAGFFYNPKDSRTLQEIIFKIINEKNLRESVTELGFNKVMNYSWNKTAESTKEIYSSVLMTSE